MRDRLFLLWGGLLVVFFLLSLGLYLFTGRRESERLFLFPDAHTGSIQGETRMLKNLNTLELTIESYVRDLALGPMELNHRRLIPQSAGISGVIVRGDTVYLDFTRDILFLEENEISLSYEEIVSIIEKSVLYNFKKVKEVIVSIDGQTP